MSYLNLSVKSARAINPTPLQKQPEFQQKNLPE